MFKPGTKIEVNADAIRWKYPEVKIHPQMTWKPATVIRALKNRVAFEITDRRKTQWSLQLEGARNFRVPKP